VTRNDNDNDDDDDDDDNNNNNNNNNNKCKPTEPSPIISQTLNQRWGSPLIQEKYHEEKACDKRR
jgi:hypothetical protein